MTSIRNVLCFVAACISMASYTNGLSCLPSWIPGYSCAIVFSDGINLHWGSDAELGGIVAFQSEQYDWLALAVSESALLDGSESLVLRNSSSGYRLSLYSLTHASYGLVFSQSVRSNIKNASLDTSHGYVDIRFNYFSVQPEKPITIVWASGTKETDVISTAGRNINWRSEMILFPPSEAVIDPVSLMKSKFQKSGKPGLPISEPMEPAISLMRTKFRNQRTAEDFSTEILPQEPVPEPSSAAKTSAALHRTSLRTMNGKLYPHAYLIKHRAAHSEKASVLTESTVLPAIDSDEVDKDPAKEEEIALVVPGSASMTADGGSIEPRDPTVAVELGPLPLSAIFSENTLKWGLVGLVFCLGILVGAYTYSTSAHFMQDIPTGRATAGQNAAEMGERPAESPSLPKKLPWWVLFQFGKKEKVEVDLKKKKTVIVDETSMADNDFLDGFESEATVDQTAFLLGRPFSEGDIHGSILGGLVSNILKMFIKKKLQAIDRLDVLIGGDSWMLLTGRSTGFHVYMRKLNFKGAVTTEAEGFTLPHVEEIHFDLGKKQQGGKLLKERVPVLMVLRENEADATSSLKNNVLLRNILLEGWNHFHRTSDAGTAVGESSGVQTPDQVFASEVQLPDFRVKFRRGFILLTEICDRSRRHSDVRPIKWALQCSLHQIEGSHQLVVSEANIHDERYINSNKSLGRAKWSKVVELPEKVSWIKCVAEKGWLEYSYTFDLDL